MSGEAHVRDLTLADTDAYVSLRREMLEDTPWSFLAAPDDDLVLLHPERFAERVGTGAGEPPCILGVDDPGPGAGLVAVAGVYRQTRTKVQHRAGIWGVYTTPRARRAGLARRVVQAAIERARSWPGVEWVALSVSGDAPGAIALYESLGFERWGLEPEAMQVDGVRRDELHMALRL